MQLSRSSSPALHGTAHVSAAATTSHLRSSGTRRTRQAAAAAAADAAAPLIPSRKQHLRPCLAHRASHSSALAPDRDDQHAAAVSAAVSAARVVQVVRGLLRLWLLQQRTPAGDTTTYAAAVQALVSDLGPLWVKLGQTLAVRPDVVGQRLAAALAGLQESAPPFPTPAALAILEADLGAPADSLFDGVCLVASASLGQVYQATIKGDGRLVAVKVQRPGLGPRIALDLSILTQLLRLLRWAGRIKQDITLWAVTLAQGLAQELDYVQEAHNLTRFASAHSDLPYVSTPRVIWELTTQRVLTTTWVEGQTPGQILRQLQALDSSTSSLQQQQQRQQQLLLLVDLGIRATLHQLVVTGVLHGDPHTGNLLLSRDNKLVFLDFGLLVDVPPSASVAMMAALLHWSQANWLALAADMRQMGLLKPTTDLVELSQDLQQRFEQLYSDTAASAAGRAPAQQSALLQHAGAIGFAEFAGVIAALALKYRFELPPFYTLVIRSLSTLEGFALSVDETARSSIARTAVKVVARQLLVDTRPAARQLLREVLVLPAAPGQPGGSLNLQLLEELLQLSDSTDWQPSSVSPSSMSSSQPVDLVPLCQQLGLSSSAVASQLSAPEAAHLRALLAQHLVRSAFAARATASPPPQPAGPQGQSVGGAGSGARSVQEESRAGRLAWALSAGWSGLRFVMQLLALMAAVVVSRAVAVVRQHMQRLVTRFA